VKIVFSPSYAVDIGAHVFPTAKFALLRERLVANGLAAPSDIVDPAPASWEELALVHTTEYLDKVKCGSLSLGEIAQLELPWSTAIVEGFRAITGGTTAAGRLALSEGIVVQLGGGLHHAHAGHGEGFCMFNDVAVAVRVLQGEGLCRRVAIVDCDVHHGNGTAAIFADDPDVFTLSVHQENNYPALKPPSTLDVALDDGTGDDEYLARLDAALPRVAAHRPDLVFYLAGADPYYDDQLGGLGLTLEGLRARDAHVLGTFRHAGVSMAVTLAGGYARRIGDTVAIHHATIEEAFAALALAL
jgi:acetoin utilization deacetylase AcuC-like enzyme